MSSQACLEGAARFHEAPAAGVAAEGLRVLIVGHSYLLGINQQKLDALGRRLGSVGLLAPSNWRYHSGLFAGRPLRPERRYDSFRLLTAPVMRRGHLASYLFEPVSLGRALAAFPCDIVQIDQEIYSLTSAEVALAAKIAGRKVVVFGWENLDRPLHPLQRLARRIVLHSADAILVGSRESLALVRKWGFRRRVEVIPQVGVDPAFFSAGEPRSPGSFRAGYVGRLVREKGVDVLLDAVGALASRGFDIEARICGSGPLEAELRRQAGALGLEARVRWTGAVAHERIPAIMRDLDVLVLPSRTAAKWKEQFGHVLIEAMAMGVPVAGARSGAIPEVIGREDLVFEEEEAAGLARILERLMKDTSWRREAGAHGRARVREHYTHEAIAERLGDFWAEIALGEGKPRR